MEQSIFGTLSIPPADEPYEKTSERLLRVFAGMPLSTDYIPKQIGGTANSPIVQAFTARRQADVATIDRMASEGLVEAQEERTMRSHGYDRSVTIRRILPKGMEMLSSRIATVDEELAQMTDGELRRELEIPPVTLRTERVRRQIEIGIESKRAEEAKADERRERIEERRHREAVSPAKRANWIAIGALAVSLSSALWVALAQSNDPRVEALESRIRQLEKSGQPLISIQSQAIGPSAMPSAGWGQPATPPPIPLLIQP